MHIHQSKAQQKQLDLTELPPRRTTEDVVAATKKAPAPFNPHEMSPINDEVVDDEPSPTYISPSPPVKGNGGSTTPNSTGVQMPSITPIPMRTDPNNTLPFILQKQQLLTKSKEGFSRL